MYLTEADISESLSEKDLDIRKCKLSHETEGFQFLNHYTKIGCELECAAKKAVDFCKCLPFHKLSNV